MTEKEMKEKWCPKSRVLAQDSEYIRMSSVNRGSYAKHESVNCLGSECAMWEPLINDCGLKTTAQEKLLHLLTDDNIRRQLQKDLKDAYYKRADS